MVYQTSQKLLPSSHEVCLSFAQASELKRLAVYFDVHTQLWQPKKPWAEMGRGDWDELFLPGIAGGDSRKALGDGKGSGGEPADGSGSAEGRTYVLKPVDGRLNYIRRGRNVRKDESQPIQEADVALHAISLHISRALGSVFQFERMAT